MDNALLAMGLKHKDERIAELEREILEFLDDSGRDLGSPTVQAKKRAKLRKAVNRD